MESFVTVVIKVAVMLIMMAIGWAITKKGIISERGTGEITWILLTIVTPCLIVSSFASVKAGDISTWSLVLSAVLAAASMGIGIIISLFMFKKQPEERKRVLRFAIIFSNAGFMGMPLIQGVLGEGGVIFGSFFIAIFNLICWTYGYYMMSGGAKIRIGKILFNPGTIGLIIGLPVYLLGIKLPELVIAPINAFSDLNTPLAMLVVGSYVARVSFKEFLTDKHIYAVVATRLIIVPILLIGLLCIVKPDSSLFLSTAIQTCTPAAANCVLFAVMFGSDARLASKIVAATTLLSIITIPLVITLAQFLVKILL